ncbi:MAG: hypothetical protein Q9177_004714 [Variospora cf. flavescens]
MSSLLFGNGSDVVHWKPNPDSRGTFDILTTCVITLLLCVWTAVHLNVPPPGYYWRSVFRRAEWLMLALLAPEMVAYTAWSQRREALLIMKSVNKACSLLDPLPWYTKTLRRLKDTIARLTEALNMHARQPVRQPTLESQKPSSTGGRSPWTLAHGFYVLMGGLAISIPEDLPDSKQFVPSWSCGTWFVKQGGLHLLFNDDRETVKEEILSLSKEDIESKIAQRIPISLLELNTFGHAICALLIYILWWEKPFEVDHPTTLRNQAVWEYFARVWTGQFKSSSTRAWEDNLGDMLKKDEGFRGLEQAAKNKYTGISVYSDEDLFHDLTGIYLTKLELSSADLAEFRKLAFHRDRDDEQNSVRVGPGQVVPGTNLKLKTASQVKAFVEDQSAYTPPVPSLDLAKQDLTRLKMADAAYQAYIGHDNYMIEDFESSRWTFTRYCGDWPERPRGEIVTPFGFSGVALIYGGLHVLAWSAHFNSTTEQLLWRISSCVVMGGLPILFINRFLMDHNIVYPIPFSWGISYYTGKRVTFILCLTIQFVLFPIYVLARAYLVVECFIQLSHLPVGVYNVPEWSTYFPHIS